MKTCTVVFHARGRGAAGHAVRIHRGKCLGRDCIPLYECRHRALREPGNASASGTPRDDIRPGLRITPYKRRTVIAYTVGNRPGVNHRSPSWRRGLRVSAGAGLRSGEPVRVRARNAHIEDAFASRIGVAAPELLASEATLLGNSDSHGGAAKRTGGAGAVSICRRSRRPGAGNPFSLELSPSLASGTISFENEPPADRKSAGCAEERHEHCDPVWSDTAMMRTCAPQPDGL